jgi:crossover junction endodeoxyribonuclease RuvC
MRLIGIDPGTGIVGFGVIDSDGRNHKLVDAGVIRTPAHQQLELRLKTIFEGIAEIIATTNPTVMVIEKLFFARNVTTAMSVSHARGVIMLAGVRAGLEIVEYTPLQIKSALTGYGHAEKSQVQAMVKAALNLASCPKPDDCADALATALTHATAPKLL